MTVASVSTLTIARAMGRPANNFTLIRLGLALAVVVSHAFSVTTGAVDQEPLYRLTGLTLGEHAVNGFFAISGFLVTMSFDRRGWRDYVVARALRIAPGLIAATLFTALVLGSALTRLGVGEYLGSGNVWRFVVATLTTFKSNAALPGVFETNPFRFPMGTVWTLKYEVLCYASVLGAGLIGLTRKPGLSFAFVMALMGAAALLGLARPDAPKGVETALRLSLIFAAGSCLYVWRDRARLSALALAVMVALTAVAHGTFAYKPLLYASEAYGVIWLALGPRFPYDPAADLSYGTYLYGWPVQQSLHALLPSLGPLALFWPALAITLLIAAASWFLVEKPALRLKARALGRPTLGTIEPAAP